MSSPSSSIMPNGSPTCYFKSNIGKRQGGPLSPYLFVLVMELWSIIMDSAITSGSIKPLKRNDSMVMSHLLFVDEVLVYSKGYRKSAIGLYEALHQLQLYSGVTP